MNETEFRAEAAETVEALARGVAALETGLKSGRVSPGLINDVFRAAHSLKGVSGLLGISQLGNLAHAVEDVLDALRLGRVSLTPDVLAALEEAVELFQEMVTGDGGKDPTLVDRMETVRQRVVAARTGETPAGVAPSAADLELPPDLFSVLTEYEEHRLQDNVHQGTPLFLVHAPLSLDAFDAELSKLTEALKQEGEIITTLPSAEKAPGLIAFDILFAGPVKPAAMSALVVGLNNGYSATAVGTKAHRPPAPAPPAVPAVSRPADDEIAVVPAARTADTVRVDIEKLDRLMNVVGEIALVKNSMGRMAEYIRAEGRVSNAAVELQKLARSLERRVDELQAGIMETRMVPLAQTFERLQRIIRKAARDVGKEVELQVTGEETELDKLLMEKLTDPLVHLVRNAVDHGIEEPEARSRAGKARTGRIALAAQPRGNHVLISVADDGAGLDEVAIRKTALERGVVTEDRVGALTQRDLWNLIFMPGFSTRRQASEMSGRGVGMDVVKTNIARLSGVIDIHSSPGQGSRFELTVPITLAIIQSLIIRVRGRTLALPLAGVSEILSFDSHRVRTVEGREVFQTRKGTVPLLRLGDVFAYSGGDALRGYVVLVGVGVNRVAVLVDVLVGRQDIVIKPLGKLLRGLRGVAGATDLGEQTTVLVLDVGGLVEEALGGTVAA